MLPSMKSVLWIPTSFVMALVLASCGNSNTGDQMANTGPFDRHGNYVEEWADNPSKWRKSGSAPSPHELRTDELPVIARNDQPPAHSVPLAPRNTSRTTTVVAQKRPEPTRSASTQQRSTQVVARANTTNKPKTTARPAAKPKQVAKVKAKPKATVTRYVVKKGDSLSTIASRNGSSVAAIQRANGIKGTMIHPGQSLSIPKR